MTIPRLPDTENGVVIIWHGWTGCYPQLFEGAELAAEAILDRSLGYVRIECIDRQTGAWRDCESEVRDEVERLEQDAEDWCRHNAGTRAMVKI